MSTHFISECTEEFDGKCAIVTGGANGIGLQITKELLKRGVSKLAILDMNVAQVNCRRLVSEFGKDRLMFLKCDVSNGTEIEEAFKTIFGNFGQIDIVINNAGILDDSKWEREVLVNVNGTIQGTLQGMKYMSMLEGGPGGTIINISGVDGLSPSAGCPIYSATSHAIVGFTRSFSLPFHYSKTGVRMMVLCPGITYTNIVSGACKKMLNEYMGKEFLRELSTTSTQKPENVAIGLMQMLLNGLNGSTWVIEGGRALYEVDLPTLKHLRKA